MIKKIRKRKTIQEEEKNIIKQKKVVSAEDKKGKRFKS